MNIHSGIMITIMLGAAFWTGPLAITKAKLMVDIATDRTQLARRKVAVHKTEMRPGLFGHVQQDANKVAVSKVADLAAPKTLHTPQIEVFEIDRVIGFAKLPGQFPVPGSALVGHTSMGASQMQAGLVPVVRAALLQ